jgi:hypothetical protein
MNIINLLPPHYIEHEFFNLMISYLDIELFHKKTIYLTHDYKKLPSYGKDVIVILTAGDERGTIPAYYKEVGFVFKHHLDTDFIQNVYHIPLPYVGGFIGDHSIPIDQRKYDVFFVGRSSKREDMISELERIQRKRKDINFRVFITGYKFKEGWPIEKYSKEMMNSKIVLSPRGAVRAECLRFTEAVKCGCSIITCKHSSVRCFNECPAIYLDHGWGKLEQAIDIILKNKNGLQKRYLDMKSCWDKYFSPKAVGTYINTIVRKP